MPRHTKRNTDRDSRILEALRAGNTRKAASAHGGIDQDTFIRWMHRYADFADAVEKAESEAEIRNVAIIQKAALDTWQAAAWWLERRRPNDFRLRQEVTGADGGPMKIVVEYAPDITHG